MGGRECCDVVDEDDSRFRLDRAIRIYPGTIITFTASACVICTLWLIACILLLVEVVSLVEQADFDSLSPGIDGFIEGLVKRIEGFVAEVESDPTSVSTAIDGVTLNLPVPNFFDGYVVFDRVDVEVGIGVTQSIFVNLPGSVTLGPLKSTCVDFVISFSYLGTLLGSLTSAVSHVASALVTLNVEVFIEGSYNTRAFSLSARASTPFDTTSVEDEKPDVIVMNGFAGGLEHHHANDQIILDVSSVKGSGSLISYVWMMWAFSLSLQFVFTVACACVCADCLRSKEKKPRGKGGAKRRGTNTKIAGDARKNRLGPQSMPPRDRGKARDRKEHGVGKRTKHTNTSSTPQDRHRHVGSDGVRK